MHVNDYSVFENFWNFSQVPVSVYAADNSVLFSIGMHNLCYVFHKAHDSSTKNCCDKDQKRLELLESGKHINHACKHGLHEIVLPIRGNTKLLGYVVLGPYYCKENMPGMELFHQMAKEYSLDMDAYLIATTEVPVVEQKKMKEYSDFMSSILYWMGKNDALGRD